MEEKNQKPKRYLNKFVKLSGLGIQMGVVIYLSSLLGAWLDEYFGTHKTYTLISVLVGFLLSFISLIAQLKNIEKDD